MAKYWSHSKANSRWEAVRYKGGDTLQQQATSNKLLVTSHWLLHCILTQNYNPGCYELKPTRFPVHTQTSGVLESVLEK